MVKREPSDLISMVERASGAEHQGEDKVVATDFVLLLTPAEKKQLDRERLLATG